MIKFLTKHFKKISMSTIDEVDVCYTIDSDTDNRMIIDLKHETGDTVWVADYYYDTFYPCKHPGKIEVIEIKISDKCRNIYCWVNIDYGGEIRVEVYPEKMCFRSYDECVKWCDEYNARPTF